MARNPGPSAISDRVLLRAAGAATIGVAGGVTDVAQFPKKFAEAPALAGLVTAGKLPPVEQRLPEEALAIQPVHEVGRYGGTWRRGFTRPGDRWLAPTPNILFSSNDNQLPYIDKVQLSLAENLEVLNLRAIAGEYDHQERHVDLGKLPVYLDYADLLLQGLTDQASRGDRHA
jgi:hypothetical protein